MEFFRWMSQRSGMGEAGGFGGVSFQRSVQRTIRSSYGKRGRTEGMKLDLPNQVSCRPKTEKYQFFRCMPALPFRASPFFIRASSSSDSDFEKTHPQSPLFPPFCFASPSSLKFHNIPPETSLTYRTISYTIITVCLLKLHIICK